MLSEKWIFFSEERAFFDLRGFFYHGCVFIVLQEFILLETILNKISKKYI